MKISSQTRRSWTHESFRPSIRLFVNSRKSNELVNPNRLCSRNDRFVFTFVVKRCESINELNERDTNEDEEDVPRGMKQGIKMEQGKKMRCEGERMRGVQGKNLRGINCLAIYLNMIEIMKNYDRNYEEL